MAQIPGAGSIFCNRQIADDPRHRDSRPQGTGIGGGRAQGHLVVGGIDGGDGGARRNVGAADRSSDLDPIDRSEPDDGRAGGIAGREHGVAAGGSRAVANPAGEGVEARAGAAEIQDLGAAAAEEEVGVDGEGLRAVAVEVRDGVVGSGQFNAPVAEDDGGGRATADVENVAVGGVARGSRGSEPDVALAQGGGIGKAVEVESRAAGRSGRGSEFDGTRESIPGAVQVDRLGASHTRRTDGNPRAGSGDVSIDGELRAVGVEVEKTGVVDGDAGGCRVDAGARRGNGGIRIDRDRVVSEMARTGIGGCGEGSRVQHDAAGEAVGDVPQFEHARAAFLETVHTRDRCAHDKGAAGLGHIDHRQAGGAGKREGVRAGDGEVVTAAGGIGKGDVADRARGFESRGLGGGDVRREEGGIVRARSDDAAGPVDGITPTEGPRRRRQPGAIATGNPFRIQRDGGIGIVGGARGIIGAGSIGGGIPTGEGRSALDETAAVGGEGERGVEEFGLRGGRGAGGAGVAVVSHAVGDDEGSARGARVIGLGDIDRHVVGSGADGNRGRPVVGNRVGHVWRGGDGGRLFGAVEVLKQIANGDGDGDGVDREIDIPRGVAIAVGRIREGEDVIVGTNGKRVGEAVERNRHGGAGAGVQTAGSGKREINPTRGLFDGPVDGGAADIGKSINFRSRNKRAAVVAGWREIFLRDRESAYGHTGAAESEIEWILVHIIAGDLQARGAGAARSGGERDREGGAGSGSECGGPKSPQGEVGGVGSGLGENEAGQIRLSGVADGERDGGGGTSEIDGTTIHRGTAIR